MFFDSMSPVVLYNCGMYIHKPENIYCTVHIVPVVRAISNFLSEEEVVWN